MPAGANPKPFGVVARSLSDSKDTFLEIANDSPYPVRLAGKLDIGAGVPVDDVGRGLHLAQVERPDGSNLVLDLLPYGIAAIRIGAPQVKFLSMNSYPSEAVMTSMRARFNKLSAQLTRLNHGLSASPAEPANPGFEPGSVGKGRGGGPAVKLATAPGEGETGLAGWLVEGGMPGSSTIAIDRENPHSGEGSLKLSAPLAPASVVSESFVPNNHSSLLIEAFFRSSEPETKVRVWIEGTSGGKPYVRRTEMTVSETWEGRAVRASDVPAGGLDSARLRFELVAPGSLWIDDLHVPNETASRSGLLNARRTLLAAIQAYREELATPNSPGWPARTGSESQRRGDHPGGSARRMGFREAAIGLHDQPAQALLPIARPQAQVESAKQIRRIRMFVACNTLCFAQEPMETALRQILELEFDKFELRWLNPGSISGFPKRATTPTVPWRGSDRARA